MRRFTPKNIIDSRDVKNNIKMRVFLIAFCVFSLASCSMQEENDCVCTTSSGEQYEEYDVEGSCSTLNKKDATCKLK